MTPRLKRIPDVLVLGAGGTLGMAWLRGVLEGSELDWGRCEYFVGTSAGSVIAATLAAGAPLSPPDEVPDAAASASDTDELELAGEGRFASSFGRAARAAAAWAGAAATPVAPLALRAGVPGGSVVRAGALAVLPPGLPEVPGIRRYVQSLRVGFDGRLRIATVDRRRGRRVMFGQPGTPRASVTDAVVASCAIPWVFSPVEIDGRSYVDGGVWSPTNIDTAPAGRGTEVLCFMPTAARPPARSPLAALRAATHAAALTEAAALRARGARVRLIAPDEAAARIMGPNLMDARRRLHALEAGRAQGRRLAGTG